ncbi:MAG: right-handed parallel beta-helix repeat-containing protein [bacterium]|nr:right-handed parallel beta-helix repeat-containing protein [bacterium]
MSRNFLMLLLAITVVCLAAAPAMAQYTTFVVDDDGNPLTTYPSLSAAIATAQTYAGGPHKIVIMAGNYNDVNLTPNPTKIDEIYGDPDATPGDIVFTSQTGTFNFITLGLDQKLSGIKLVGYKGTGVTVIGDNVVVDDMIIEGASGVGVNISNANGIMVQNLVLSTLDYGVLANVSNNSKIQMIDMTDCGYGVAVANFTAGLIDKINIVDGNYGIYVDGGSLTTFVTNCKVESAANYGIWLNAAGQCQVLNNLVYQSGSYGIVAQASTFQNWILNNCLIGNTGASQGYDDGVLGNWWNNNFYSDNVYTMVPGAVTDAAPMKYLLSAVASGSSYNLGDIINVDLNWTMTACASLDSQMMAAYNFVVNWDDTKLAYVAGSADYDEAYLGPAPPALYTGISETSNSLTFAAANFTVPGIDGGRLGFAQFEVIGANVSSAISFTGADFRDPANTPVPHTTATTTFTLVDNVAPVLVSAIASNPAGDDVYSDGSVAGPGPFVKLDMIMSATDNYDLNRIEYSYNGAPWGTWIPGLTGISYTSPSMYAGGVAGLPAGANNLALRVVDAAGLISNVITYNFTIDRTAPVITAVAISDKDGCALDNSRWTNDPTVTMAITATGDPVTMMRSESGDQPTEAFVATKDFVMTGVNGAHTVWARLYDKYNNRVDWTASNSIILDNVAPVAVGPLVINAAAAKTNNVNVALAWSDLGLGGANMGERKASENPGDLVCGTAGWVPNSVGPPLAFALSAGDGMKTVYLASRDSAGNISNVLSDGITLDQTPVTITSYDMVDLSGFVCTNDGQIKGHYAWTGTDAVSLEWSYDGTTWGTWKSLVGVTSPDSTNGSVPAAPDGVKYLYIRIVDDIGNISTAKVDSIEVKAAVPALTSLTVLDMAATATPDPTWPQWSNSKSVGLLMTGLSADVVAVKVSEDGFATSTQYAIIPTDPFTLGYTYAGTGTECAANAIAVKAVTCAGVESAVLSYNIYFDFVNPVIASFTGPTLTNNPTVALAISATDNCIVWQMRLGEGSLTGVPWIPFNPAPSFVLSAGDGPKTVNLEVVDGAGNIAAASVVINLDATIPSAGTFYVTSANPLAAIDYTDALTGNTAHLTWDGDVTYMRIRNSDGSGNTGYIPVASPFALNALVAGGPGPRTLQYWFRDAANNVAGPFTHVVDYSNVNPNPPAAGTATGTPLASCLLEWGAVTDAQKYIIKFNFQNQYPTYDDPIPPHPLDRLLEGILATDTVTGLQYVFDGPQPDIYSFSIWTLSKHGLYSLSPNIDVTATNYILGDFEPTPDGCIDFGDEFGELAVAYNSISTDPNFNMYLDIAPTSDMSTTGYPMPDLAVDFEDLVIFALNYDEYLCSGSAPAQPTDTREVGKLKAGPLAVVADIPDRVKIGDEFVVPFKIDQYEAVKAFHVTLGLNNDAFEVVRIDAGSAYEGVNESFFYSNPKSTKIDVSGTVLGRNVTYTSDQFFTVTIKALKTGDVNLEELELTFRDRENKDFQASLTFNRIVNGTLPTAFALSQNYPNPFNPTTSIELALPVASEYTLTIYNVLGQEVKSFSGFAEAGFVRVDWDATDQSSGIYLYKVTAGRFEDTKKMVLIK